jgi:amidase
VADLENDMNNYLSGLEKSDVKTLKEIVEWNRQHADEALPSGKAHYAIKHLGEGILNLR